MKACAPAPRPDAVPLRPLSDQLSRWKVIHLFIKNTPCDSNTSAISFYYVLIRAPRKNRCGKAHTGACCAGRCLARWQPAQGERAEHGCPSWLRDALPLTGAQPRLLASNCSRARPPCGGTLTSGRCAAAQPRGGGEPGIAGRLAAAGGSGRPPRSGMCTAARRLPCRCSRRPPTLHR